MYKINFIQKHKKNLPRSEQDRFYRLKQILFPNIT
jgi:hypothetical protein